MDEINSTNAAEAKGKVLYIEDDSANISLMEDIFSEFLPYDFIYAMNGEDGIAMAKEQLPNLILLDINMHGLGGYEALAIFKSEQQLSEIPVFAVSGDVLPEQIEKALEAGFTEYITKPFNVIELMNTIKNCLN